MNRHHLSPLTMSVVVPLAVLVAGCTTTKTTIVTTSTHRIGWTLSRSATVQKPGLLTATIHRTDDQAAVQVVSRRACVEEYLVRRDRQRIEERRVSTGSKVTVLVFEAVGAYLLVSSASDDFAMIAEAKKDFGLMHMVLGGVVGGIALLQTRTDRTELPREVKRQGVRLVPCTASVGHPVRVEVKYAGGSAWGLSDEAGSTPVVLPPGAAITAVEVNGVPVPFRTQRHEVQSSKPSPATTHPQPAKSPTPPVQ